MATLCSPGFSDDSRCYCESDSIPPQRGHRAPPTSKLCPLKNVGGFIVSGQGLLDCPATREGLRSLRDSPIDESKLVCAINIPKSTFYARHITYLASVNVVRLIKNAAIDSHEGNPPDRESRLRGRHPAQGDPNEHTGTRMGGAYGAVYKDTSGLARATFDMRPVNTFIEKDERLSVLSAAQLICRMRSIHYKGGYRIVHGDLSNAYYQFPVGPRFGRKTCLRSADDLYEALVLPMGVKSACGICQRLVWAAILYCETGEERLGVDASIVNLDVAPSHVDLDDGGFICLVYDSFLVIAKEDRAAEWYERLKRNFARVNGHLKYLYLEKEVCKVLYCGVLFEGSSRGLTWALDDEALAIWQKMATLPMIPSPRTVYSLAGRLRFCGSVLEWQPRRLGKTTTIQSDLGEVRDWDAKVVDPEKMRYLCDLILSIKNKRTHRMSHLLTKRSREGSTKVCFIAVDATKRRWSFVEIHVTTAQVVTERAAAFADDPSHKELTAMDAEGEIAIEVGEAIACLLGETHAYSQGSDVIILAVDNQIAGNGFWKGRSHSDGVRKVMNKRVVSDDIPIVVVDIPTEENIADVGTRPTEIFSEDNIRYRLRASYERMKHAYERWKVDCVTFQHRSEYDPGEHLCGPDD